MTTAEGQKIFVGNQEFWTVLYGIISFILCVNLQYLKAFPTKWFQECNILWQVFQMVESIDDSIQFKFNIVCFAPLRNESQLCEMISLA